MAVCRGCGAEIMWVKTSTGKKMPIDFDDELIQEVKDGAEFDPDRMQSHFATCSEADKYRK